MSPTYALGWMTEDKTGATVFSHSGSNNGFIAYVACSPESGRRW